MKKFKKHIIALLALLTISATGAWADEPAETLLTTIENTAPNNTFKSGSKTFDNIATVTFSDAVNNDGDYHGWYSTSGATLTVAAASDAYTITRVKFYSNEGSAFDEAAPFEAVVTAEGTRTTSDITKVNGTSIGSFGVKKIEVYGYSNGSSEPADPDPASDGVEVTETKDEKGNVIEASFDMPQNDVTVTYTLKRDMGYQVNSSIVDRIRIKKVFGVYVAVNEGEELPTVTDGLLEPTADPMEEDNDYTLTLQKQSETDPTVWTDVAANALSVGTFHYVITGTGDYSGTITTQAFQLYEGYEVTVAPGEYATYYRESTDENLKVEENSGNTIYTITEVGTTTATATELTVAPAGIPLLVKNNGTTDKVLLIPTTEQADDVEVYGGFIGVTDDTYIPASNDMFDFYALNGKEFVWVKNPVSIAANKAWLQVPVGSSTPLKARALSIVFGGNTTAIDAATVKTVTTGDWYDLNGRKLQGIPTKKGVYILNGKKVVVK